MPYALNCIMKIFLCFACLLLNSCVLFYGIKHRTHDEKAINNFLSDYSFDESIILKGESDTFYRKILNSCPDSSLLKNLLQPLQVHYFSKDFVWQASLINCYVFPGFLGLKWNKKGNFNSFPPKTHYDGNSCRDAPISLIKKNPLDNPEGYILVFWDLYLKRQSKRLLRQVLKNSKGKKHKLLMINNDEWFDVKN